MAQGPEDCGEVTHLLEALRKGDEKARSALASLVYSGLHEIAERLMARERPEHTLQATALVHEAYLKLAGQETSWQNRAHFFAVASQVMRRILVDYARSHRALKRGGLFHLTGLEDVPAPGDTHSEKFIALDEALSRLSEWDLRQSQVVEMRFFGGLTEEEIAHVLGTSVRTVKRDWSLAKAWLYSQLGR